MPKETKEKKVNPLLADESEEETTEEAEEETTDETTDEVEADEEDTDADDEETEEEAPEKPAKAAKGAKAKAPAKKSAKAKSAPVDEDEDDDDEEAPAPRRISSNEIQQSMLSDIQEVEAALAKQPMVRFFIPLGIGERKGSPGAVEAVSINGWRKVYPKGEYISVPQAVADLLEAHYNMAPEDTEAGQAFRLDRPRTKEGISTDAALN